MPVPETYASKVTKADFIAVAELVNDNETGVAAGVSALTAHEAAADPHPDYLTEAAANAAYRSKATIAAKAITGTSVSLPTGTDVAISFEAEEIDTDGFHDNAVNPTRLTIPAGLAGRYLITGQASFAVNATGDRVVQINKNGARFALTVHRATATFGHRQGVSAVASLAAGEYLELIVQHNVGSNLATVASSTEMWLALTYLGTA